jgi:uncharacterized protein (DUF2235 family)
MPKRIVYLSDGTWQGPADGTNIYKLSKAFVESADQHIIYDDGIGADATGLNRIIEGAFATTIFQKIIDGYKNIAHAFAPGDQIYLFGYSRGAYTARCIAGMIANCGLPSGSFTDDCVDKVFSAYRTPAQRAAILATLGACNLVQATIAMIGAYETVGSLGIPAIFGKIDVDQYGFLDTNLHPNIKNAFHCLAIDEHRPQFPATLWTPLDPPVPGQTIEQIWFTGCHGDLGGGNQVGVPVDNNTRLCDISMGYMLGKGIACGLTADPAIVAKYGTLAAEYAMDTYTDTWKPVDGNPNYRPIDSTSKVSNSVAIRTKYLNAYRPQNLKFADDSLADTYTLIDLVSDSPF